MVSKLEFCLPNCVFHVRQTPRDASMQDLPNHIAIGSDLNVVDDVIYTYTYYYYHYMVVHLITPAR